ncbi:MAG: YeeE/YedE thiosulfate transporter family protein [Syntrophaceae bacterium]
MNALFPIVTSTMSATMEFLPVLVIGFLFGVALEVAGFGNSKVLASQFYFHDMRVFKVMFTSIITAATGVALLSGIGLLDVDALYVPDTFIVPLMVGGFILGLGFMLSAYCPGTSIVGAASGRLDGVVTFIGVIIGSVIFGMLQPSVQGFYMSTAKGVLTFPKLLGLPFSLLAFIVVCGALLLFLGADRLEGVFARKLGMPEGQKMKGAALKTMAGVAGLSLFAMVITLTQGAAKVTGTQVNIAAITPIELGQMLVEDPRSLIIADLRQGTAPAAENIPSAVRFSDIKDNLALMYKGKTLVVFSQDGNDRLPSELTQFAGRTARLQGGYEAWKTMIMGQPEPAYQAFLNASEEGRKSEIAALHAYFTGAKMEAQAETRKPVMIMAPPKKRSGGCS